MQTLGPRVRFRWVIGALAAGVLVSHNAPLVRASDRVANQARARRVFTELVGTRRPNSKLHSGTARVAKMETVPIGVTKPQRGYLEGGPVARFAWKPLAPGYKAGFMESYKAEIAAYKLDQMLELHRVPAHGRAKDRRQARRRGVLDREHQDHGTPRARRAAPNPTGATRSSA